MSRAKASESCYYVSLLHRHLANSPFEVTPTLSCPHPTLPAHDPGLHRSFCQCLFNKYCVLYKLLCHCWHSITEPGKDTPEEAKLVWPKEKKRYCNHVRSKEVTDYKQSPFRTIFKHLGGNLSKIPYFCLPSGKLTYHIKCIHFCKRHLNALYRALFPSTPPQCFPAQATTG